MVTDFKLNYTGQQVDSKITNANNSLQISNLTNYPGSSTTLAMAQYGATNLYEKIYNGEQVITKANNVTKTIDGVSLSNIIDTNGSSAKYSTNTTNINGAIGQNVTAITQSSGDNSTKVSTTEFVTNAINVISQVDVRSMTIMTTTLTPTTININQFCRQINFVYGTLDFNFSNIELSGSTTPYLYVAQLGANLPKTTINTTAKLYSYSSSDIWDGVETEISSSGGFIICKLDDGFTYRINRISISFAYEITES